MSQQWDIDCANSEQFHAQQVAMARRDAGDADALGWAWARAKLAKERGLIPCPDCGGGFYMGCDTCGDTGFLNADGSRQEHAGELLG